MNELPTGWAKTSVGTIAASLVDGPFGSNLKTEHYELNGARVIRLQNIADGRFDDQDKAYVSMARFNSLKRHDAQPGDVLIAALGEILPRVCLVPPDIGPAIVKADCFRLRPYQGISGSYIAYILSAPQIRRRASTEIAGVGRPRLNLRKVSALPVPIPPSAEQERIVAAIEKQFSRLDAGVAALERARQNLIHMRTAVLRAAVTAPAGTRSVYARDLFSWASGKRIASATNTHGRFPIFGGNGITGRSDEILKAEETIVIGRVGALCGNVYLTNGPAWITDNAIYAQSHAESILLPYAVLVFRSARLRDRAAGTGQPFVNQRMLNEVAVPLPSNDHQADILARHDASEEALSHVEQQLHILNQRQMRLRSSILAAAFAGNLVSQDPQDEPASALLERIAAERMASNSHKPTRTRKPRVPRERVTV